MKSQHSEVTLNYQLEHFGCMTWTKYIINKSAFAETKFCLYGYNLKNAAAFLQRKYFPKVTCHEWKWSCCQTSCEDLNLHPHVRLQTVQPAVLTPSPLNPANIPLLLPRTCATFGLCSDLCRIYMTARPAEELFPDHGRWSKNKIPDLKIFRHIVVGSEGMPERRSLEAASSRAVLELPAEITGGESP